MHPLGPASVVAFKVDGYGPYSLESMIEANTAPGVLSDEELITAFKTLAPGEVYPCPIGGGWTQIEAVLSPGFEEEEEEEEEEVRV